MLGYWEWLDGLERGLAAHHAGLLPAFKEVVEELFVRGLVKAVFATETLALGINMPARCVVLERLVKFNGEAHVDLTPGEYTQLTGRAGRRGIDVEGHAVVLWSPEVDPRHVAGLASTRTYPLRSQLPAVVQHGGQPGRQRSARRQARELLESSFAQFQADRSVVGLARQVQRNDEALAGVRASRCAATSATSPSTSRSGSGIDEREKALARQGAAQRRAAAVAVAGAAAGRRRDPGAERAPVRAGGRARPGRAPRPGEPRPLVLTEDRWAGRISPVDFPTPVEPLARVRVPKHFNHRSPQARRDLAVDAAQRPARRTRRAGGAGRSPAGRRRRARPAAPASCASTPATPARPGGARPLGRAARPAGARHRGAAAAGWQNRTGSLARTFDRVCALLTARGYLAGSGATPAGHRRRPDAGPDLDRGRPAGRRVPAGRGLGRAVRGRAGRGRVRAGLRGAPGGRRAPARLPRGPGRATRSTRPGSSGPSWRRTSSGTGWR